MAKAEVVARVPAAVPKASDPNYTEPYPLDSSSSLNFTVANQIERLSMIKSKNPFQLLDA